MQPHEIKPDTELCTVIGYNAQTGYIRRYFNKILKKQGINATAIALNLTDDNFEFTMRSLPQSKVDKMMIEQEFRHPVVAFCDVIDEAAKRDGVDFIEVREGKIYGYNCDKEIEALFENSRFLDDRIRFIAKMMLIANRWYGAAIDTDAIVELIRETEPKGA